MNRKKTQKHGNKTQIFLKNKEKKRKKKRTKEKKQK